jgi:aminoglycoside phosphotransferase family enzyme/predicted kinase
MDELTAHRARVAALADPAVYDHPVDQVVVHETHISSVVLAGDYAYKLKKPLDLGFLDFRELAARRYYCQEELRVNARLAPAIYRAVVALTEGPEGLRIDGEGEVVDYAVCMERFDQSELLGQVVATAAPPGWLMDRMGDVLADFHAEAPVAGSAWGQADAIQEVALGELDALKAMALPDAAADALASLATGFRERVQAAGPALDQRRRDGAVRECHGDLHLDNVLVRGGAVMAFDAIEFSPELRWIDTANDMAFPVMDLFRRGLPAAARRLRSRYLEACGDYGALTVLPLYTAYRALVRAKVAAIKEGQAGGTPSAQALMPYLATADQALVPDAPRVLITYGLSGSGKSTVSQKWVEQEGVIRLRSDVERKRLYGLRADADSGSGLDAGIYTAEATERTYERLAELARSVLRAGFTPLVDATFLRSSERQRLQAVAADEGADFAIIALENDETTLRQRLRQRAAEAGEASEADERVLERQLAHVEPLGESERRHCIGPDPG